MIEIMWPDKRKRFSHEGDSGSLVFVERSRHGLALIVGGGIVERDGRDVGVSYACSLKAVLKEYDTELLGA
jgi:hypothetical protein